MTIGFCLSSVLFGQTQPGTKLANAYTTQEISVMSPAEISRLNFIAENSYSIHNEGKPGIPKVLLSNLEMRGLSQRPSYESKISQQDFNPLLFKITPLENESIFIQLPGGQVVQIFSRNYLDKIYDQFLVNQEKMKKLNSGSTSNPTSK